MKMFRMVNCCFVFVLTLLLLLGCCLTGTRSLASDEKTDENTEGKIRLLFVYGGHPFDEADMDTFLNSFPELVITKAKMPEARDMLRPGLEKNCDVILFFDMDQNPITDEQKANIKALFEKGIGIFAWHHHYCSNSNWDEYYDMVGARTFLDYHSKNPHFRGKDYPTSTFMGGQVLDIKIVNPEHPVTQGVKDFTINDEAYGKVLVHPEAEILLTCDHEYQNHETAWVWHYGKSTIVGNLLGHDVLSWKQPEFRQIFIQSIRFLAAEKNKVAESENQSKE